MIIPDLNLLMYAYNPGAKWHDQAKAWWEELLGGGKSVGIPWIVVVGFVRLSTTRGVLSEPVVPSEALRRVETWEAQPGVVFLNPGPRHLHFLRATLEATAGGALSTDAHLAALAMEYQAEFHSNDSDFGRFAGLRWRNPLGA